MPDQESFASTPGIKPATKECPWTGNRTCNLLVMGWHSSQQSQSGRVDGASLENFLCLLNRGTIYWQGICMFILRRILFYSDSSPNNLGSMIWNQSVFKQVVLKQTRHSEDQSVSVRITHEPHCIWTSFVVSVIQQRVVEIKELPGVYSLVTLGLQGWGERYSEPQRIKKDGLPDFPLLAHQIYTLGPASRKSWVCTANFRLLS